MILHYRDIAPAIDPHTQPSWTEWTARYSISGPGRRWMRASKTQSRDTDDADNWGSLKMWCHHAVIAQADDKIYVHPSSRLLNDVKYYPLCGRNIPYQCALKLVYACKVMSSNISGYIQNIQFNGIGFVCTCVSLKPPAFCDKLALCDMHEYYLFLWYLICFCLALWNSYFKFYWHLQSA